MSIIGYRYDRKRNYLDSADGLWTVYEDYDDLTTKAIAAFCYLLEAEKYVKDKRNTLQVTVSKRDRTLESLQHEFVVHKRTNTLPSTLRDVTWCVVLEDTNPFAMGAISAYAESLRTAGYSAIYQELTEKLKSMPRETFDSKLEKGVNP